MSLNLGNRSLKVGSTNVPVVDNYEDIKCTWWFNADNERFYISLSALTQREIDEGKFTIQFMKFKYNSQGGTNKDIPIRYGFTSPEVVQLTNEDPNSGIFAIATFQIEDIQLQKIDITDQLLPFLCADTTGNRPNSLGARSMDKFHRLYKFGIRYSDYMDNQGFLVKVTRIGKINSTLLRVRTSSMTIDDTNITRENSHNPSQIQSISCKNNSIFIQYND